MRGIRVGALTIAACALIITAAGCAAENRHESPSAANAAVSDNIVLGEGRDRTASQTIGDWVTYADHVVVITVLNESRHAPSQKEIDRGEGMIARTVKLRVDEVLWSAPDTPQPAPVTLDLAAAGWVFNNNNGTGTVKFGLRHASRLDKGHTYIRAIEWVDDPCSDNPKHGKWEGLGSGDTIPFDRGVLGAGEFEGRVQTLAEAKARRADEPGAPGLRDQMAGEQVETLVASLRATAPRPEKGYVLTECDPSDR